MGLIFISSVILALALSSQLTPYQQCLQNPTCCPTNSTLLVPPTHTFGQSWFSPMVSTPLGYIKGQSWYSRSGRMYFAFVGINYAEITARFEASRPVEQWKGVLDATRFGPMCMQLDPVTKSIFGAEHCLFLNVYSPQIAPQQLLPVMVWIHGGNWQSGGGDQYNPKNFMDHNIVLVTFNYRLNALGFLSTGDEVQGNMGLKDQVNALLWIKQNIRSFGGDPNKITLFGSDTGASSVHLHALSPLSQGIFQQGIAQSGSALSPFVIQTNPKVNTRKLAEYLNCDTSSNAATVRCLRSKSDLEIMDAQARFGASGIPPLEPILVFGPVVEMSPFKSPVYLSDTPQNLIRKRQIMRIPWMMGMTEDEGRFYSVPVFRDSVAVSEVNSNWNKISPVSFLYNDTITPTNQAAKDGVSNKIRTFYMQNKPLDQQTLSQYSNIYTDRLYKSCLSEAIKTQADTSDVFAYILKFRGDFSYADNLRRLDTDTNKPAPSHNDELHYMFNWKGTPDSPPGTLSYDFSAKLVNLWVSFATLGRPVSSWGTTPVWKPVNAVDANSGWYGLDYDTSVTNLTKEETDRIEFWKSLPINVI